MRLWLAFRCWDLAAGIFSLGYRFAHGVPYRTYLATTGRGLEHS